MVLLTMLRRSVERFFQAREHASRLRGHLLRARTLLAQIEEHNADHGHTTPIHHVDHGARRCRPCERSLAMALEELTGWVS